MGKEKGRDFVCDLWAMNIWGETGSFAIVINSIGNCFDW